MTHWPCPLGSDALFAEADSRRCGSVSQAEASGVWARVLLDSEAVNQQAFATIWRRVAPSDGGGLSRDAFSGFLRLCALVQAGHPLTEANMACALDARRTCELPSPLPPPVPRLRGGVPAVSPPTTHGGPPPGELSAPRAFAARGGDAYADTSSDDDEPSWARARETAGQQQRKERGGSATNPLFEIQAAATREGSSTFTKRT